MRRLALPLLLLATLLATKAGAAQLIAVLPLDVSHAGGKLNADAQASIEEMLRDIAANELGSQGWTVLTGETTLQILQDNGKKPEDCGKANCHLGMARELNAEKFISGSVQYVDGQFTASIRLIDTASGRIAASELVEGKNVTGLRAAFKEVAARFFVKAGLVKQSSPTDSASPPLDKGAGNTGVVTIAGGTFPMGADDITTNEQPVHQVTLPPYSMDRTEVTVGAYAACVKSGKCSADVATVAWKDLAPADQTSWSRGCNWGKAGQENHPINCVDWNQAKAYCEAQGARLPTEAEWEFAARGKDASKYPWGAEAPGPRLVNGCGNECRDWNRSTYGVELKVVFDANDGWPITAPVGSFPAGGTPLGLQDMAGNVSEWVADAFANYTGVSNAPQSSTQSYVFRGGNWASTEATWLRGSHRNYGSAVNRYTNVGFRCARSVR